MTHPMIGGSLLPSITDTRVTVDEWATAHYPTPRPKPAMSIPELAEASRLLSTLHELVGVQADEVMALLTTLMVRRDDASMTLLRCLRSLDEGARG